MTTIAGRSEAKGDFNYYRFTILNSIRLLNSRFHREFGEMVIAVDGKSNWRKERFPYYKASRKTQQDKSAIDWAELKQFTRDIADEIKDLYWRVVTVDQAEADDIIAVLCKQISKVEKTVIVSRDKDFFQLHRSNQMVSQWDPREERMISVDDPARALFELVIKGDNADGIPNVYCNDDHFVNKVGRAKPITSKLIDSLWEGIGIADLIKMPGFKRNVSLVDFNYIPTPLVEKINQQFTTTAKQPKTKLVDYISTNQLPHLYKNIGDF